MPDTEETMPNYGGQAVIEGVMMRGKTCCAIAVRAPDQSILVETEPLGRLYRSKIAQIPFTRGLLILWDALVLGIRALTFSANIQVGEETELEGWPMILTLLSSLAISIGLFFLLPAGVAHVLELHLGWSNWWSNFTEGFIRLLLLIGYIWVVGFMPDVRRVFGYHGAEHKTINAFEAGAELNTDVVAQYPREHTRCGTAFLLTVVLFSILLFSALGPLALLPRLLSRIFLIPVLAAIAYEYIRLTNKWLHIPIIQTLISPNLALQRLTTREPEPEMIEVAIAAFEALRTHEASKGSH